MSILKSPIPRPLLPRNLLGDLAGISSVTLGKSLVFSDLPGSESRRRQRTIPGALLV